MAKPNPAFRFGVHAVGARFEPEQNPEPKCPLLQVSRLNSWVSRFPWSRPGHEFGALSVQNVTESSFRTPEKPENFPRSNAFERRTEPERGFRFCVRVMPEPNLAFAFGVQAKLR
ncbi:hypothetical protein C8F04DRAFT_1184509 [Mycena alexandri]|uniref:Uncharacterized protein n=1 Tax=Mycena alexandri TaxID=1745969 RepID=A0AAD6X1E6_9AGAR|nr:hypothetical protein C8F04DRAFT_1184509 [Mycena alexandri]